MDARLREAAHEGSIERLYALIREDPSILEHNIDDNLFADTPLHVVASTGNQHFAAELMRLKPSYARKLNPDGLSPIQLALLGGHDRMVEWFVSVDSNLVRDQGREGMTPLHYAVAMENGHLLKVFLLASPNSIEGLTTRQETVIHIALKFHKLRIFEVLLRWLKVVNKEDILNWPDKDGNTVLHTATSKNQTQAVELLLSKNLIMKMKVNAKNNMGLTALDIFQLPMELDNREIGDMLCRAKVLRGISVDHDPLEEIDEISKEMSVQEIKEKYLGPYVQKKLPNDMSQAILTVAVLIATATFQAALSPPGGLWQETTTNADTKEAMHFEVLVKHYAGTSTMTPLHFFEFYLLNSATFYASMGLIRLHTQGLPHRLLRLSYLFLCATYYCSLFLIHPINTDSSDSKIHIYLAMLLHSQNVVCILAIIFAPHLLKLIILFNKHLNIINVLIIAFFLGYAIYLST
ncbi:ankyrin repeat-containing protein BDA1-like [Cornus florida]|uniref:ankyrin repeat-containing protein BDA1-like n=1 Tax=Cornus florida TaxID=4283 RepID=UPI00289949CA|nr:ankyrin repeat-containing protein BDA1-like [Cornus florida]